ncbi:hypothetical protein RJ55_01155 [Drechmeria coniospora]|nr:hypothetical protein RJ55_01155 [Drechmeria coniospora]
MDPFSITTGVVGLLTVCFKVGVELKKLRQGAKEVGTTVTAMLADVNSLRVVLISIEESFEELDATGPPTTGHIGLHLAHIRRSLSDGGNSLSKVERLLVEVNREVAVLDAARRHLRLKNASDQLMTYRQEVQAYKDALQLSLQTVTVFGQVSIKEDTTQLLANAELMHGDISRLATNLDVKLCGLEALFRAGRREADLDTVVNLRDCVRSAASVVSSSVMANEPNEPGAATLPDMPDFASELGEFLRFDTDFTLNWVHSSGETSESLLSSTLTNATRTPSAPPALAIFPPPDASSSIRGTAKAPAGGNRSIPLPLPSPPPRRSLDGPTQNLNDPPAQVPRIVTPTPSPADEEVDLPQTTMEMTAPQPEIARDTLVPRQSNHKRKSFSLSALFSPRPKEPREVTDRRCVLTNQSVRRKMVFVGDGACGKTCFLVQIYVPTVFENYLADFVMDTTSIEVALWDTAGQEEYDRLRPLSYPDTDIFCICFTIDDPTSLENVTEKWITEIELFNSKRCPIFLLGLKKDLRDDPRTIGEMMQYGGSPISTSKAETIRQRIGAEAYFECSAKTGEGVVEAFEGMFRSYFRVTQEVQWQPVQEKSSFWSLFW